MSKKPETNPIDEALLNHVIEAIADELEATNCNHTRVTFSRTPLKVNSLVDSETVTRIDKALEQAHKKLTQDAETNESNDTGETYSSDSCDCSCDREVIIDLFSKIFNKTVSDSNEEENDNEALLKTICKNAEVNIPVCSALDISLVRRLFKKVYKETGCFDPDELLSSEYSLKFCQATDSFIISLKSLETDEDIYIELNDDGSTQISGTLINAVIYVDGERKTVDMLYAWAARNLIMSGLVRVGNDED